MKNNFMISIAKKENEIVFSGYLPDHDPINFSRLLLPVIFWAIVLTIQSGLLKITDKKLTDKKRY